MSGLNSRQRAAVRHVDGPLLVLAGAGSGKTRVITQKIAHLIGHCGMSPRNILAVTFTNKAAREMKQRATALLKGQDSKGLSISTFHSLGIAFLRREHKQLGFKAGFSIFDSQDSMQLITELVNKARLSIDPASLRWQISSWKNELLLPDAALGMAEDSLAIAGAEIYAEYQRHLKAYNALDFDDLIMQPVCLLQENAEVREHWQNRVRHLLVDEYQDTNTAQYQFVRHLVGKLGSFTAVGDDDQSIYTWRGARPENLQRLQEDFPRLKVVKLEQNYRSTACILQSANQLIANNPHAFEKKLWSELGFGSHLRVLSCSDPEGEAERVVTELLAHQFTHGTRFGDYAILYRGNHQSRPFEKMLRAHRINYQLSGGMSFFEYSEVRDLVGYLRLLINGDDDRAFLRVVNTPRREIGAATLEKLGSYATERGISLLEACFEIGLQQHLGNRAYTNLQRFAQWIVDMGDRAERGEPLALVKDMIRDIDYENWLRDNAKDPREAERRLANVDELLGWLERMTGQLDDDAGLKQVVERMALLDMLDREKEEGNDNCVHMSTLHAAKGLEFPHVFLVGMEENLLPHRVSIEEDNLEEERRLAYVGITRAQRSLTFTLAARRKRAGEWERCEPSRFLAELPQDNLQWEGRGHNDANPEQRQQRGKAHLANLKGLLS